MSGNSCASALQTAPIVSDLPPPCGGAAGALDRVGVGAGVGVGGGGWVGVALGHGLAHRAR